MNLILKGRLENELKHKQTINNILKDMPSCVTDYYYKIQTYTEPVTCINYIYRIKHFLDFIDNNVTQINLKTVSQYFESIRYTQKNGELTTTSNSYKQITWTVLNQFFEHLVYMKCLSDNPMRHIKRPKKKDEIKRVFLSMEDLNKILLSVKKPHHYLDSTKRKNKWKDRDFLILYLLMNTGMRETALCEINVQDINFKTKQLNVTDKRDKNHIYVITDELEQLFKQWINERQTVLSGYPNTDALFVSEKRNRISSDAVRSLVQKYSLEALGYAITPHKLRSSFVSLYYQASGNDIEATKEAVGHSSIATTSRYIVKQNNSRAEAARFMSDNLILS